MATGSCPAQPCARGTCFGTARSAVNRHLRENVCLNASCGLSYLKGTRDLNCLRNWGGKANSATGDKIEKARSKKNKGSLASTYKEIRISCLQSRVVFVVTSPLMCSGLKRITWWAENKDRVLAKRAKRIPKGVIPSLSVPNIEDVDDDKDQEEEEAPPPADHVPRARR